MIFKFTYSRAGLENETMDALVVFLPEKKDIKPVELFHLTESLKKIINTTLKQGIFNGKLSSCERQLSGTDEISQILLVGLGTKEKLNDEEIRRSAGAAGKFLTSSNLNKVGIILNRVLSEKSTEDPGQLISEGLSLGGYEFNAFKSNVNRKNENQGVHFFDPDQISSSRAVKYGSIRADATNLARNLGNSPPNVMSPIALAEEAKKLSKFHKLKCKILEEKDMKKLRMGMFLGVSQGSRYPAKLIITEYHFPNAKQTLAIVGKGITFDSGGISLKPGKSMDEMKFDMCGAAAVIGTMIGVSKLKPKINVIGVIPAAENLPGGEAQRPGDIVTAHNGKTVEILNTDAEGRLILGDALSYTVKRYKPDAVIDLATLTGACVVALGHHATGALTNHDAVMKQIRRAGDQSGERVWELPNFEDYGENIKGKYGDLLNSGGPAAGTITAGKFLENFVNDTPWVHLDIAGTAWNVKYVDYQPSTGATGVGVRLLIDLICNWKALN